MGLLQGLTLKLHNVRNANRWASAYTSRAHHKSLLVSLNEIEAFLQVTIDDLEVLVIFQRNNFSLDIEKEHLRDPIDLQDVGDTFFL